VISGLICLLTARKSYGPIGCRNYRQTPIQRESIIFGLLHISCCVMLTGWKQLGVSACILRTHIFMTSLCPINNISIMDVFILRLGKSAAREKALFSLDSRAESTEYMCVHFFARLKPRFSCQYGRYQNYFGALSPLCAKRNYFLSCTLHAWGHFQFERVREP